MLPYQSFSLDKVIPNGQPYRVYGVLGDAYLQTRVVRSLLDHLLPESEGARDFNFDSLDGEGSSVGDVLSRCGNLPFLSDRRVVIVRRAEKLEGLARSGDDGESKKSKGPSAAKRLSDGLAALPLTTLLILCRTPETPEPGGKKETLRCINANVDKVIENPKVGMIIDCTIGLKSGAQAVAIVNNEAAERNIPLERGAAERLVERVGHNIAALLNDLEKCALRVGTGNVITRYVVEEMTRQAPHETVFDLMDAIGTRQSARAVWLLREILGSGDAPEQIMALLTSHIRQLLQARAVLDARLPLDASLSTRISPQLAEQFPRESRDSLLSMTGPQAWKVSKLGAQARNFSMPQLQNALEALLKTDLAMKGIEGDGGADTRQQPTLLMELLIVQLCNA